MEFPPFLPLLFIFFLLLVGNSSSKLSCTRSVKVVLHHIIYFSWLSYKQYYDTQKNAYYLLSILFGKGYFLLPSLVLFTADPKYCLRIRLALMERALYLLFFSLLIVFITPFNPHFFVSFLTHCSPTFSLKSF